MRPANPETAKSANSGDREGARISAGGPEAARARFAPIFWDARSAARKCENV